MSETPLHTHVYRKLFFHLSILGIAVSIFVGFYDVIFHTILETLHFFAEIIEESLDHFIEHQFETDLHETQIIVFYIMLVVGGIFIYFIWKMLVELVKSLKFDVSTDWVNFKIAVSSDWQHLSTTEKIVGIFLFFIINYLLSFFIF